MSTIETIFSTQRKKLIISKSHNKGYYLNRYDYGNKIKPDVKMESPVEYNQHNVERHT